MRENKPRDIKKRILATRLILVGGLIILVLVVIGFSREVVNRYEINRQVEEIQTEIDRLESANSEMGDMILYFGTKNFQDKLARQKLNVSKPGEQVVAISTPEIRRETPNEIIEQEIASENPEETLPSGNPARWWLYLFGEN